MGEGGVELLEVLAEPGRSAGPAEAAQGDDRFEQHPRGRAGREGGDPLGESVVAGAGVEVMVHQHRVGQVGEGAHRLRPHGLVGVGLRQRQQFLRRGGALDLRQRPDGVSPPARPEPVLLQHLGDRGRPVLTAALDSPLCLAALKVTF